MRLQAIFRLFVPLKHWGETFKYAASVIGLPIGDYPFSYRPQGRLPEVATPQIRTTLERAGMTGRISGRWER